MEEWAGVSDHSLTFSEPHCASGTESVLTCFTLQLDGSYPSLLFTE